MIITRTPLRISLFGGGSDYPQWYEKNPGIVVSGTINKYCYVTTRVLPPFFDYKYVVIYSKVERVKQLVDIQHPTVNAVLQHLHNDIEGLEIHYDSDLPARSGMGTSSSFTVALLAGVRRLLGKDIPAYDLALEAMMIERDKMKEVVGDQDHLACALGGLNVIRFSNGHRVEKLLFKKERMDDLSQHLLLVFTGVQRTASDVAATYDFNREAIGDIVTIANCGISAIVDADYTKLGRLMTASWELKKSLSKSVSSDSIDELHSRALSFGAHGGKLLGAGGGGFMLFVVPDLYTKDVITNDFTASGLVVVPFHFEEKGVQVI